MACMHPRSISLTPSQAYQLLLTLAEVAKRNRAVILSIHQPRSDAFNLFSRLLILSKGSVVYSGPTSKCLPWFASLGFTLETGVNPLDFLIDISSVEIGDDARRDASRARVERLVNEWKQNGRSHSTEKSSGWSRREVELALTRNLTAHGTALNAFFSADEGGAALRRLGLISQTVILTSRYVK